MSGLAHHVRDLELPARAGDPRSCAFESDDLTALVQRTLARPNAPRPIGATLEYARWKPFTSLCALYRVALEDGEHALVTLKRYATHKAVDIAKDFAPDRRTLEHVGALTPFAALPDEGLCLYAFPADRALPGLGRAINLRRTARFLNGLGLTDAVRGQTSKATLLRFKPEHRAVLRLDLGVRDAPGDGVRFPLAVRVLAPTLTAQLARSRARALSGDVCSIAPRVVACEERTGLLFEEWLDVDACAADDFSQARAAGELVARLHAEPLGTEPIELVDDSTDLAPLFSVDAKLRERLMRLTTPRRVAPCSWIHGDLHPDQVALQRSDARARLLDWDSLRPGRPAHDLATWIADHLGRADSRSFEDVAAPLLDGYSHAGGTLPVVSELQAEVALALVRRAAAVLRRLERGAIPKAAALLDRAESVALSAPFAR